MGILTWFDAVLKLGLPMVAASWLAFGWLYGSGEFERDSTQKEIESRVKKLKKNTLGSSNKKARFLLQKWSRFGGGFYGLTGLWTLVVFEVGELLSFLQGNSFSGFGNGDIVGIVFAALVSQISSFISAAIWFSYWPEPEDSVLVWVLVAYVGYRVGIQLAKRSSNWSHANNESLEIENSGRVANPEPKTRSKEP